MRLSNFEQEEETNSEEEKNVFIIDRKVPKTSHFNPVFIYQASSLPFQVFCKLNSKLILIYGFWLRVPNFHLNDLNCSEPTTSSKTIKNFNVNENHLIY